MAISEVEKLHAAEVNDNVARTFDFERVTRKFYDRFKLEHAAFLNCIQGITAQSDREWYASLMLNRLMFIYFIQRKGFLAMKSADALDGDPDYLSNRLKWIQQQQGEDQFPTRAGGQGDREGRPYNTRRFHTFYRCFLLRLFHDGLSKREHAPELEALLGRAPYLNGGLFDVHRLEHAYPDIDIPDEAFERLFAFFDEFDWRLDNRPLRNDKEINPDVPGYIFEKYINQKQIGAYYTKEDITGYISQNTIIAFIFDDVKQKEAATFRAGGPIWSLLREDPDKYIYDAVKKGCQLPLPPAIEVGMNDVAQRGAWNKAVPEEYALPTEIWREVVARRTRYFEVRAKLAAGEISSINDLITYNLDIRQFASDVITYCEEQDMLLAFYNSIASVTVLDPTCGSGAFLFAALNILEPLYEACLVRMQIMVDECDQPGALMPEAWQHRQNTIEQFRAILQDADNHPSRQYFIYKSIIINNLYGVDIMEEATEICKLRLLLKLFSQVEQFNQIELLPDIDFNIRAGNALVGFASFDEAKEAIQGKTQWQESHRPLHWWIEFHGIMKKGGFDVIIGNPPYLASSKVKGGGRPQGQERMPLQYTNWGGGRPQGSPLQYTMYRTGSCGNVYACIMERSLGLLVTGGYFGMIVPVSSIAGESYKPLVELFVNRPLWLSSYSNRPGKLFAGVEQRLTIFIVKNRKEPGLFASAYHHWYESERAWLFQRLAYVRASLWPSTSMPIKSGSLEAEALFKRLMSYETPLAFYAKGDGAIKDASTRDEASTFGIWIHDGPTYWVRALPFEPNADRKSTRSNHYHRIAVGSQKDALVLVSVFNSSTFYFFFKMVSNCRDLGQKEWSTFPFGKPTSDILTALANCGRVLEECLHTTAVKCTRQYPSGTIEYEEYYPAKAKPIIDEIDRVLAKHYGFSDEELDFIINYDIKYRMGRDSGDESEE